MNIKWKLVHSQFQIYIYIYINFSGTMSTTTTKVHYRFGISIIVGPLWILAHISAIGLDLYSFELSKNTRELTFVASPLLYYRIDLKYYLFKPHYPKR